MKPKALFRALAASVSLSLLLSIPSIARADFTAATAINFYWEAPAGSDNKVGTWLIRETEVTATGDAAYFAIIGNWTPPFYIGIQELSYRTGRTEKVALFSAWDTYDDGVCTTCSPESREGKGSLTKVKALGQGVSPGVFGFEGTGVNAFMNDFYWSVGDRVRAAVNLRPLPNGTEISAAIQRNDEPWRFFATYVYSKVYHSLQPGYSFIEDFGGKPYIVRSAEFRSSWGESENLDTVTRFVRVGGQRNETTPQINPGHRISQRSQAGIWGEIGSAAGDRDRVWRSHSVEVPETSLIPVEARIAALNLSGQEATQYRAKHLKDATRFLELQVLDKMQPPAGIGTLRVGETLSVVGPGLGTGSVSYQWRRNNQPIQGATKDRYQLGPEDSGAFISVEVTANLTVAARSFQFDFASLVSPRAKSAAAYKNCAALQKVYPGGVAKSARWVNKGARLKNKPAINSRVYDLNRLLDRDKDGLVCER